MDETQARLWRRRFVAACRFDTWMTFLIYFMSSLISNLLIFAALCCILGGSISSRSISYVPICCSSFYTHPQGWSIACLSSLSSIYISTIISCHSQFLILILYTFNVSNSTGIWVGPAQCLPPSGWVKTTSSGLSLSSEYRYGTIYSNLMHSMIAKNSLKGFTKFTNLICWRSRWLTRNYSLIVKTYRRSKQSNTYYWYFLLLLRWGFLANLNHLIIKEIRYFPIY